MHRKQQFFNRLNKLIIKLQSICSGLTSDIIDDTQFNTMTIKVVVQRGSSFETGLPHLDSPNHMLVADVIKMNNTKASANYNTKFSDSNNNNRGESETLKMGVKYQATSFDRFNEDREVSLASNEHRVDEEDADVEGLNCDDTSMESAKSVNRSLKRSSSSDPDDIGNNKRHSPVLDNNMATDCAAAVATADNNDDDDEDYEEDNDSVLSVGRDENNFVAGREEVGKDELKPQRSPPAPFISKDHQSNNIPCGASPAAAPSCDKLDLGLSFRNIHNHLTSLKQQQQQQPNGGFHSPLENMFAQNPALWKNSAFEAAGPGGANPSALIGFSGWAKNPTAELLHRYDMLRGNLMGRPPGGGMNVPHNHHHHHPMTHDESLKFSIDNILKADFGRRRITDPINKLRKISNSIMQSAANFNNNLTTKNKLLPTSECSSSRPSSFSAFDPMSPTTSNSSSSPVLQSPPQAIPMSTGESPRKLFSPVDLTSGNNGTENQGNERSQSRLSESSSSTGKPATSSGGAPMVWPAWVYCTRYSDRPSSGEFLSYFEGIKMIY